MRKTLRLTFLSFLAIILMGVPLWGIFAANGEGLTISPPLSDINVIPGQSIEKTIRLSNPTGQLIEVYPEVMNFKAGGQTGEPSFYEETGSTEKFSLAKWITFNSARVALAPEQIVEFSYKITVPENAEPGGHYGAIFFSSQPNTSTEEKSQVSLGSMIGSLILGRVPGEIVEKGTIETFLSDKKLYTSGSINLETLVKNSGNIHFNPKGNISVKDFGGKEVANLKFNEQGGNVLPDSSRKFTTNWNPGSLLIGKYTARVDFTYGNDNRKLSADLFFWVIPLWVFAVLGSLLLFFISLGVYLVVRSSKKKFLPRAQGVKREQVVINKGLKNTGGEPPVFMG